MIDSKRTHKTDLQQFTCTFVSWQKEPWIYCIPLLLQSYNYIGVGDSHRALNTKLSNISQAGKSRGICIILLNPWSVPFLVIRLFMLLFICVSPTCTTYLGFLETLKSRIFAELIILISSEMAFIKSSFSQYFVLNFTLDCRIQIICFFLSHSCFLSLCLWLFLGLSVSVPPYFLSRRKTIFMW